MSKEKVDKYITVGTKSGDKARARPANTCDHPRCICRCRDFQPSPGDSMFCRNCICPASFHSARALEGKSYVRCVGSCSCHTPKAGKIAKKK